MVRVDEEQGLVLYRAERRVIQPQVQPFRPGDINAAGQDRIRMRILTEREYARLQGVPDHYPITVSGVQALTGFGDAVCVPAIAWIARNVLNTLIERFLIRQVEFGELLCPTT